MYGIALVPDVIFYLNIKSAEELVARVLASGRGFDYWESGMDLYLGEDFYDSFVEYQTRMLREFDRMKGEYGFRVLDASRSINRVAADLRRAVARVIDEGKIVDVDDSVKTFPTAAKRQRARLRKAETAINSGEIREGTGRR
jgi:dTMP kinase